MVRFLLFFVCLVSIVRVSAAAEPAAVKEQAEKLVGIWSNQALAKNVEDMTRLLVTFASPKFAANTDAQVTMTVMIFVKDRDGGGGRTVRLGEKEGKGSLTVPSGQDAFKGLPRVLLYRLEDDKLILTVGAGDWKGEYVLKKKWDN